ncbi:MAG: tRNA(Ile)-lysidine synthetase [Actinomycetia bacterium]|nr:tRNA(Ile)-lysidine synthetase [Actinomycetes bacterium]
MLAPWLSRLPELDRVAPGAIVACSGGADSLALLALAQAAGIEPVPVHVDHQLRAGSNLEARVVEAAAALLGVTAPVDVRRVDVHSGDGANLEAAARRSRYRALDDARREHGAASVLVGHTADDQAETVLLALLRGSATTGLGAMAVRRDAIVRPLLGLRRSDTVEICARLGLEPLDDPMNHDPAFRRVWLRREVIPHLARVADRDIVGVLAGQAEILRSESGLLDSLAAAAWPLDDPSRPSVGPLRSVEPVLARRALRLWVGPPAPSRAATDSLLDVALGSRRSVELADRRTVTRSAGRLTLTRGAAPVATAFDVPGTTVVGTAGGSLRFDARIETTAPAGWPDPAVACVLDADVAGPRLRVRAARGSEAALVPATTGEPGALVLAHGTTDRALWAVGYRGARAARVTAATRRFLWIAVDPISGG